MQWPGWVPAVEYSDLILEAGVRHGLPRELIATVIMVESGFNPNAVRMEPGYAYTWNIRQFADYLTCTYATMEMMQKTSWGLMQVMGGVAYEVGLADERSEKNRWPTALLDPELGMRYGCRRLKAVYESFGPDPAAVYAAYNGGSGAVHKKTPGGFYPNQRNVDRFMRYYREAVDA